EDSKRVHLAKPAAELRDDIEIIFIVGTSIGNRGIDRHRALRIEMLDLILECGIGLQMCAYRGVAAAGLAVKRRGQLRAERNLCQNSIERIIERVAALRREWRVHFCLLEVRASSARG